MRLTAQDQLEHLVDGVFNATPRLEFERPYFIDVKREATDRLWVGYCKNAFRSALGQ